MSKVDVDHRYGVRNLSLDLTPNINVLVGANGAGKSRVLSIILDLLRAGPKGTVAGATGTFSDQFESLEEDANLRICSSGRNVELYQPYFKSMENIEEFILNGEGERVLDQAELAEVNYILCAAYTEVIIHEVQPGLRVTLDAGESLENVYSDEIVPFVRVKAGERRWTTCEMGSGEYAALYLWWLLNRQERNSVLLIEEPEAYLSYKVQERLADCFAKYAVERKLFLAITTHSYPFIARYPDDSIIPLLGKLSSTSVSRRKKYDVLSYIGAPIKTKHVIIAEDRLGKYAVEFILSRYLPELFPSCVTTYARDGASDIRTVLQSINKVEGLALTFVGVYDEDQRDQPTFTADDISHCKKVLFPLDATLEETFIEICVTNQLEPHPLHPSFNDAMHQHQGSEPHDHLRLVAETLRIEERAIWDFCLTEWEKENRERIEAFSRQFSVLLA
ncbi:ATP-dependent nuclease [Cereibacter sphaeroides]|uniref:ATP-dependent nuclease n=1 Tax=Cereibacter sphaeroides TaxID=1063 RepID=UPI003FCEA7E5